MGIFYIVYGPKQKYNASVPNIRPTLRAISVLLFLPLSLLLTLSHFLLTLNGHTCGHSTLTNYILA